MRYLTTPTLVLACALSTSAFAQQNEALNYNIVNVQAEAARQVSNDEMHAILYIEKVTNNLLNLLLKLPNS